LTKRKLTALSAVAAALIALAVTAAAQSRPSAGTIDIGWVGDKSGPVVSSVQPQREGLEAYIRMVNSSGGVDGHQINLIEKDDQYNPTTELSVVKSLISDNHVPMIMGLSTSSGWGSVIPLFNQTKTVAYAISANVKQMTYPFQPWVFEGNCNLSDQGDVAVAYELAHLKKKNLNGQTVGVAAIQVASGQEWTDVLDSRLQKLGATVVNETLPASLLSADVQVGDLLAKHVSVLFFHHSLSGAISFLNSVAKLGLQVPIISSYGPLQDSVYTTAPYDATKYYLGVNCLTPTYLATTAVGKAAATYGKKYGIADSEIRQFFYAGGWVSGQVLVQALKNAHGDYSSNGIKRGLEAIKNLQTGLSGAISFGPKCHIGLAQVRPYTYSWKNHALSPVGSYAQWAKYITHGYAAPGTCGVPRG